jgi:hypothetical protein
VSTTANKYFAALKQDLFKNPSEERKYRVRLQALVGVATLLTIIWKRKMTAVRKRTHKLRGDRKTQITRTMLRAAKDTKSRSPRRN